MTLLPLGASHLSEDGRYFVTRAFNSTRWEVWLQATGQDPNTRLAPNLEDLEAARIFCENHQTQLMRSAAGES